MTPFIHIGGLGLDLIHIALLAAALGAAYLAHRRRDAAAGVIRDKDDALKDKQIEVDRATDTAARLHNELETRTQELTTQRAVAEDLGRKLAAAEARSEGDEEKFAELAASVLQKSNSRFLELANETFAKHKEGARGDLEKLMTPIGESFAEFRKRVEAIEKVRTEDKSALKTQVEAIAESLRHNTTETGKLVNALTAPKGGGRWGEMTLRNVMEQAGLSAHCDFNEQVTDRTEAGAQRPDAVIYLPGDRQIVIDSKVSLDAYMRAADADNPEERAAHLKTHAQSVERHVRTLASKSYQNNLDERVDFVAMFIPGENFFAAALEHNPSLLENAYAKNVIITTPSTLIGLAKTVSYVWRQEKMAENAREAATLGAILYERLVAMGGHVEKLGRALNGATESYSKMTRSLESRVLPGARRFKELGIETKGKTLPTLEAVDARAALPDRSGELDFSSSDDEAA